MTTSLRRIAHLGLGSALAVLLVVGSVPFWGVSGPVAGRLARITIVAGAVLAIALVLISRALFVRRLDARDRAATALQRSWTFLDSVIEQIPHMVFIKDATDLRFVSINRSGEELLGYARAELIGKSDFDFFPAAEARFFVEKDREVLARGTVLDIPEEIIHTRHKGARVLRSRRCVR